MKKLFIFLVQSPAKVIKNQIKLRWYLITKAFYLFHVIFLAAFRGVYMCCPLAGHPLAQLLFLSLSFLPVPTVAWEILMVSNSSLVCCSLMGVTYRWVVERTFPCTLVPELGSFVGMSWQLSVLPLMKSSRAAPRAVLEEEGWVL